MNITRIKMASYELDRALTGHAVDSKWTTGEHQRVVSPTPVVSHDQVKNRACYAFYVEHAPENHVRRAWL